MERRVGSDKEFGAEKTDGVSVGEVTMMGRSV